MGKISAFITAVLALCSAVFAEAPGYNYLYTVTKDTDKIISASVLQDEAEFISWKKGELLCKDVFSGGSSWKKYMDFDPENFGVRIQEKNAVRLSEPAMVSVICYNPAAKIAALLIHLNNANSVISVCDMAKNKQVYTSLVKTPPHVPGRRVEFMAIDRINLVPVLSEDAATVAYGVYTYLYTNSVEILDIASGRVSKIDKAAIPFIWKQRVYYLDMTDPAGKKFMLKTAMLDGTKREEFVNIDFEPAMFMMQRGVLYTISGTKVYALRIGIDKKFIEIADSADLFAGLDSPVLSRIFPVVHDSKEFMIFVVKIIKDDKTQLRFYSKQL
jgi:hypothetical protein